ncbi:putative MFS family arabinose efflux permease [Tamaricihabitans halophyticus]|uniref:Putative MFS family arabinose efflux permease n=1 Tax=Tamaricihabitans halophyticus TaxID=1262583 RepID=A0A4R2R4H9_9PSEU|nr:MFS transporter [Tamaricihabitans halophyticus]TCP54275.1 putative MFS family arabinose efflux permease [Tamaricihabitans halophyticus]
MSTRTKVRARSTDNLARRWALLGRFGALPIVPQLLLLSSLAFNLGFYLVLPFLATHLATDLAMAGWIVGMVLGLRTFSQQGLFFLGGALADRFGTKPVVLYGCIIRIAGFVVLAFAAELPMLIIGTVLTGFAAALFSPAVEAELARQSGELEQREVIARADMFALYAVFAQVGAVTGPLAGAFLLSVDFTVTCLAAAGVFVLILFAFLRWLPREPAAHQGEPMLAGWAQVLHNRQFLIFAATYSTWLLSYNQLYLALPVELERATGGTSALGWLFALAAGMVVVGQLPIATFARRRLGSARALPIGFALLAASFATVAMAVGFAPPAGALAYAPAVALVVLLTLGQMAAVPVAQDAVARLAGEQRLGAHFGVLHTAGGVAVLLGSSALGSLLDGARTSGPAAVLPWALTAALPAISAVVLIWLTRRSPALRSDVHC